MDLESSATPGTPARAHAPAIAAAIATISAVGIGIGLSGPLFSLIMERQGYADSQIGLSTAFMGASAIVVTPVMSRFVKALGVFNVMMASIALTIASFALIFVLQNAVAWFAIRFLFGIALTGVFIVSEFWINSLAPDHRRGLVMGIYATFLSVGFAAGPAILGWVGSTGGAPFYVAIGLFCLSFIPVLLARSDVPRIEPEHKSSFWPFLFAVPLATGAVLIFGAAESSSISFLALYGTRIGLGESVAVSLVTAMAIGGLFCHIPLGLIADRFDRRKILLFCGITGMAGAALLPTASGTPPFLFAILLFWGGITAGLYTVGLTHLGSRFKGGDLASANAAFVFCYAVGMIAGPASVGAAMDVADPHGFAWSLTALFAAFSLLAVWRLAKATRLTSA